MSFFISEAHAQSAGAGAPPGGELFALFYFIAIRPQRKRQKEHAAMVAALSKGDEVVTTSGILGKVTKLDDDYVVVSVTDNVELKFQRSSIHAVLPKGTLKAI